MSLVRRSDEMADGGGSLPAFVERAREDAQCRAALARIGYSKVKAAYALHQRSGSGSERLHGLEREHLWPPTELVRDWLNLERKRILGRARWTFLGAMLATIVVGLVLAGAFFLAYR
jgi:hypothetical protein